MKLKPTVILYHGNCPDGFTAAWAAWKKFGNRASYLPMDYQAPDPDIEDKELYFLDFSCPPGTMRALARKNKRVVLIDHHKSAAAAAEIVKEKSFSMDRSGAALAWSYFHPKRKMPRLVSYIEDGDLWKFRKPRGREILSAIGLESMNFKVWSALARKIENPKTRKIMAERGSVLREAEMRLIHRIADKAELVRFGGRKALAANCPVLVSEVGNELVRRCPPFGIIWHKDKDKLKVSLRSNGKFDVAKLAERFGGGGHKPAASFRLAANAKLPWLK